MGLLEGYGSIKVSSIVRFCYFFTLKKNLCFRLRDVSTLTSLCELEQAVALCSTCHASFP